MRTHALLLLVLAPAGLTAQHPRASPRAIALAGAYTVSARGYEAASWNPAMLGLGGQPGFSLGLPAVSFEFGSNTYGLGDLRRHAGRLLTFDEKTDLLAMVDSSLAIRAIAAAMPLGISIGRFALVLSGFGDVDARLGKDAVELALFGNAHRSGAGRFFSAAGSRSSSWGVATVAASYAVPIRVRAGELSAGITVKHVYGLGLARGAETASLFQVDPAINAHGAGHAIYTRYPRGSTRPPGTGFGVDLGAVLRLPGGLTLGATVTNVVASLEWNRARFQYERVDYLLREGSSGDVLDSEVRTTLIGAAIDTDPMARALRDSMLAIGNFSRVARAGATARRGRLRVSVDALLRLREGLDRQPSQAIAVGAELSAFRFLDVRGGIANDLGDGIDLSVGLGMRAGAVRLDAGLSVIRGSEHPGVRFGAGLSLMFGVPGGGLEPPTRGL